MITENELALTAYLEIRNRIYTLLADAVIYGRLTLLSPNDHALPAEAREWHEQSRCALGLEQTCHQIRSEFRPIHQSWYKVRVSIEHAHWYLEDFFIAGAQAPDEVEVKFALIVPESGTYPLDKLMKILNEYPNIQFTKRPARGAVSARDAARVEKQILEGLLYAKDKNPKWWNFYKEHVTELSMYFFREKIIRMYINIKWATAEAWQLCGPTTKDHGYIKDSGKMQDEMGLDYLGPMNWFRRTWTFQEGVELEGHLGSYGGGGE
jgi:hypothetical protein